MTNEAVQPRPVIGSRGSQLARWQADHVAAALPGGADIIIIKTAGDRFLDQSLQGQADKGFFTKEIEDELLAGRVDLAVHSLKDLPTTLPAGLALGAVSRRAAVADLLLVHPAAHAPGRPLPVKAGGKLGATSLRRQSLVRRFAPDLEPLMLRGNVPTRLDKLRRGDYDAIIIARAGIDRLGLSLDGLLAYELDPRVWLPAAGQAVLGLEIREGDSLMRERLQGFHDETSFRAVTLERGLLARFEGGCHTAFGAWAVIDDHQITVRLGHEDATGVWRATMVEATRDEDVLEAAYARMAAVLDGKEEEATWQGAIAQPFGL